MTHWLMITAMRGWDVEAADRGVVQDAAAEGVDGREEAHRFFDDGFGVGELRQVGGGGEAIADDGVDFGGEAGILFGILGQQEPGPGQGVGGGFVAGEEEGHDFVAELAVGHAGLIDFVAGGDELGEQVAAVAAGLRAAGG